MALQFGADYVTIGKFAQSFTSHAIAIGTGSKAAGPYTISLGYESMYNSKPGNNSSFNIAFGAQSMAANSDCGSHNIGIGYKTLHSINADGGPDARENTAIGRESGIALISGNSNIFIGYLAGSSTTTGSHNIVLGRNALCGDVSSYQIVIGCTALSDKESNIAIGYRAAATSNTDSMAIGRNSTSSGIYALALGCMTSSSGPNCISIGQLATSTRSGSIALGYNSSSKGDYGIAIGYQAGVPDKADDSSISIGLEAGYSTRTQSTGGGNVFLGYRTGYPVTTGMQNIHVGYSNSYNTNMHSTSNYQINIGSDSTTSGNDAISIGRYAAAVESGIAIGRSAHVSGLYSIALGQYATCPKRHSIAMGFSANAKGEYSITLGCNASSPDKLTDGSVAIGFEAGLSTRSQTTGGGNVFVGFRTGRAITTGLQNVHIGFGYSYTTNMSPTSNFQINIGADATTSGEDAMSIGRNALSGSKAIAIGPAASAQGTRSIAIGQSATSSGAESISLGFGANSEGADAVSIGRDAASSASQFTIGPNQTDCRYYDSSGWTNLSDIRVKYDILPVQTDCLAFINTLQIKSFRIKHDKKYTHYGFIAQDVLASLTEEEKTSFNIVTLDPVDGLYYLTMQPIFIKHVRATQQLSHIVNGLKNEIANLRNNQNAILAKLAYLEMQIHP